MADQQGNPGNIGNPGEGSHGGTGGTGGAGGVGLTGPRGPQGPAYSSWITRNVLKAYLLLAVGVFLSFVLIGVTNARTTHRIQERFKMGCEAGNDRSRLQLESFRDAAVQLAQADLEHLFNLDPEQAAEVRKLSLESSEKRIAAIPFLDCRTGRRIPPAPVPSLATPN